MDTTTRQLKCVNNGGFPHLLTEGKIYKLIREETYGYTLVHDKSPIEGTFPKNLFEFVPEPMSELEPEQLRGMLVHQAVARGEKEPEPAVGPITKAVNSAMTTQVGGSHYTKMKIQPYEYCHVNRMGYVEGTALKYLSRWRDKGGLEDLEKAKHAIEWLIEYETSHGEKQDVR